MSDSMDFWEREVNQRVLDGNTGCQVEIPDGKYIGDPYIVTDARRRVLAIFAWDGTQWVRDDAVVKLQDANNLPRLPQGAADERAVTKPQRGE